MILRRAGESASCSLLNVIIWPWVCVPITSRARQLHFMFVPRCSQVDDRARSLALHLVFYFIFWCGGPFDDAFYAAQCKTGPVVKRRALFLSLFRPASACFLQVFVWYRSLRRTHRLPKRRVYFFPWMENSKQQNECANCKNFQIYAFETLL